jgi:hypothetical protein
VCRTFLPAMVGLGEHLAAVAKISRKVRGPGESLVLGLCLGEQDSPGACQENPLLAVVPKAPEVLLVPEPGRLMRFTEAGMRLAVQALKPPACRPLPPLPPDALPPPQVRDLMIILVMIMIMVTVLMLHA